MRGLIEESLPDAAIFEADTERLATEIASRERPDLLILDLHLAQGSGLGVLRAARSLLPASRFVMLTQHADHLYRDKSRAAGADAFYDKNQGLGPLAAELTRLAETDISFI